MIEAKQDLQMVFLDYLIKNKVASTVFLVNGVKLQGVITSHDAASLLLRREAHAQLIYKHAISTIMPNAAIGLFEGNEAESDAA